MKLEIAAISPPRFLSGLIIVKNGMVSTSKQAESDYDNCAIVYNDYTLLPSGQLESELIEIALGDCKGLTILDLGGGTGVHARQAIDLGAVTVDIIDISAGMLSIGGEIEKSLGRENRIRFHQGDVSMPLSHLQLQSEGYDIVMGNWIFSFADSMELLEEIFSNILGNLKAGGRFIGVRDADPWSPCLKSGKYGGSCKWIRDMPGGVRYLCVLHSTPPIEFEGASLEVIYSGSSEIYERFGLTDVKTVSYESAKVVQNDLEFWQSFLERPCLAVVTAVKE